MQNGNPGFMANIFNGNRMVMDNILYSLLDFYVMVEKPVLHPNFMINSTVVIIYLSF